MHRPLVGTVTIGQAPRPDVTPIIEAGLPAGTTCVHTGLLDGLTRPDAEARYGQRADRHFLVTRLLDGSVVRLDAEAVEAGLRDHLLGLEESGCDIIVLLCTGVFHSLRCDRAWLVEPDRVIPPVAAALLGGRTAGIVLPDERQVAAEGGKWSALAGVPRFAAASPYTRDLHGLEEAARRLAGEGAAALILDCIGFTERHRSAAATAAGVPVLLSNAIIARVVGELAAAWGAA
jgi:protein AroM